LTRVVGKQFDNWREILRIFSPGVSALLKFNKAEMQGGPSTIKVCKNQ
jgi:hypothetical protein